MKGLWFESAGGQLARLAQAPGETLSSGNDDKGWKWALRLVESHLEMLSKMGDS